MKKVIEDTDNINAEKAYKLLCKSANQVCVTKIKQSYVGLPGSGNSDFQEIELFSCAWKNSINRFT